MIVLCVAVIKVERVRVRVRKPKRKRRKIIKRLFTLTLLVIIAKKVIPTLNTKKAYLNLTEILKKTDSLNLTGKALILMK